MNAAPFSSPAAAHAAAQLYPNPYFFSCRAESADCRDRFITIYDIQPSTTVFKTPQMGNKKVTSAIVVADFGPAI